MLSPKPTEQAPALQRPAQQDELSQHWQGARWPVNIETTNDKYQAYWNAIRQKVCSVCLDQANDGSCGLTRRTCAIEKHLPRLAQVLSSIDSPRMDEYVAAVQTQICSQCPEQDAEGRCDLRNAGECALDAYLFLVLEAVEEINAAVGS